MRERIAALASDIRRSDDALRQRAGQLRKADPSLVSKVSRSPLSISVCAVDGGLMAQRVHGADIVVHRSVGVDFVYVDGKLASFSRIPSKAPEPFLELESSLDEHEANVFRSLVRLKSELGCAIASLDAFSPGLLLMDGSLLPLPSDRPEDDSALAGRYKEVLELYSSLFAKSNAKDCMLCGVIKDSRARKLSAGFGLSCSDTLLCRHLLDHWERTRAMPYFQEKQGPAKDLLALSEGVEVFYLKPSEHDLPLRIEAYRCDIDKAASLICTLSAISENFAYPAVLIEADMCAALDPASMEAIESSLLNLSGLKPLRRNSRPFR